MPTNNFWDTIKWFKEKEFDSPDLPGSGQYMNQSFVEILDRIRAKIGKPMKINSGYRTPEHNVKVKGVVNSSHLKGIAADIYVPDNNFRFLLVKSAIAEGITRFIIHRTYLHIDMDYSKDQNIMELNLE